MPGDAQDFIDAIYAIPKDLFHLTRSFADALEDYSDAAALRLRVRLSSASWLPEDFKPAPPPPVYPDNHFFEASARQTWFAKSIGFLCEHAAVSAAVVAFVGTGSWLVWRQRRAYVRKRRAKRGPKGQRTEVVVVVATQESDIATSLILDLERRGFTVYVAGMSVENIASKGNKSQILPFHLNVTDPVELETAVREFNALLSERVHSPTSTATDSPNLNLSGVIIVPDLTYPVGPIETITPDLWSDSLNAKVLHTIATTQAFLQTLTTYKARLLLLTPTVIPSLRPAFHAVESTVVSALDAYAQTLRAELGTLGVQVCHLKLGTFDANTAGTSTSRRALQQVPSTVVRTWSAHARSAYARNFVDAENTAHGFGVWSRCSGKGAKARGSPLRELHNAVFDALTVPSPSGVWRVGRGSLMYEVAGLFVPPGITGWMMGLTKVELAQEASGDRKEPEGSALWEKVERIV